MIKFTSDKMTLDEFERQYAERSGVTVAWLHANDRFGVPCDCGEEGCEGWQMKHRTTLQEVTMEDLTMAMEDFNAEMTQIEYDLFQAGVEHGPDGELVQVDTPWAMGFVDKGVSLV